VLVPSISTHGSPYVYLTTNYEVALIYTVRTVEQFYSKLRIPKPTDCYTFYPYGFNKNGKLVIHEYYPDAFDDIYGKQSGYVYTCTTPSDCHNPTNIGCALVSSQSVSVLDCVYVADVGETLLRAEREGKLIIMRYDQTPQSTRQVLDDMIRQDIKSAQESNSDNLIYFRSKFPHLFEIV